MAVPVTAQVAPAQERVDVACEQAGLAHGVLGVRGGGDDVGAGARRPGGDVRDRRAVAGGEDVAAVADLQRRRAPDPTAGVEGQVGPPEQRVGHRPRRHHDGVGRERRPAREHDVPVLRREQPGRDADLDPPADELGVHARGELRPDLGHDPVGRLEEHPPDLLGDEAGLVAGGAPGHVLELAEHLETGEARRRPR